MSNEKVRDDHKIMIYAATNTKINNIPKPLFPTIS